MSLACDLLGGALGRVDWHEIAAAYAAEYADQHEITRQQHVYLGNSPTA